MNNKEIEASRTRHDVACELQSISRDMKRIQKSLFDVGLASLGATVGGWIECADRAQAWIWPKGDPMNEK